MALDKFKRMDIIINNINEKMDIPYLEANADEYNGRILRIQLTNNGIVEEQTATITFGFIHTSNKEIKGTVPVPLVDKSKGIYELSYPTEMLKPGIVACAIKIIDGKNVSVKRFKVEVTPSLFTGDMEVAPNSISAFDKALIDINSHEGRIVEMELNFKELAAMLTMNIPHMDTTISSRASQTSVDKLDGKVESKVSQESFDNFVKKGFIKRIQKGTVKGVSVICNKEYYNYNDEWLYYYTCNVSIPYSVSNEKSILLITANLVPVRNRDYSAKGANGIAARISGNSIHFEFDEDFITKDHSPYNNFSVEWQIIEFY